MFREPLSIFVGRRYPPWCVQTAEAQYSLWCEVRERCILYHCGNTKYGPISCVCLSSFDCFAIRYSDESRSSEDHVVFFTNGKCIISEAEEAIVCVARAFFRRFDISIHSSHTFGHLTVLTMGCAAYGR